ncbi:MAG: hypothetical protein WC073_11470 [Sterolibacterium sp.]
MKLFEEKALEISRLLRSDPSLRRRTEEETTAWLDKLNVQLAKTIRALVLEELGKEEPVAYEVTLVGGVWGKIVKEIWKTEVPRNPTDKREILEIKRLGYLRPATPAQQAVYQCPRCATAMEIDLSAKITDANSGKTHFADDATLKYIAELEASLATLQDRHIRFSFDCAEARAHLHKQVEELQAELSTLREKAKALSVAWLRRDELALITADAELRALLGD